jgi:hypothetical protein
MDNYLLGSLVIVTFIGLSCYQGYIGRVSNWVNTKRQKVKLLLSLMDKIKKDVSTEKKEEVSFTVNNTDKSASIVYERMGQQYIMLIPYNRKYVAAMSQFKAELLRKDNKPLDITQQPGIPYIVNADSLGGYAILMTNQETGKSHEYSHDIIPMYGEEIIDTE